MDLKTRVNVELQKPANYLIMGWWSNSMVYRLTDAGIPVVKVADGTSLGYSVYSLKVNNSTAGASPAGAGSSQWRLETSTSFIHMQQAYIDHLQAMIVTAKMLRTSIDGARTEIDGSGIKIFNSLDVMNIRFGMKDGYAVMEYYDNDGRLLYDLGPSGITTLNVREEKWTPVSDLVLLGTGYASILTTTATKNKYMYPGSQSTITYYHYTSKIVGGVNQDAANDGKLFVSASKSSSKVSGIFCRKVASPAMYRTQNTGNRTYPPNIHPSNEAVYDTSPLYSAMLIEYAAGVYNNNYNAYWNGTPGENPWDP